MDCKCTKVFFIAKDFGFFFKNIIKLKIAIKLFLNLRRTMKRIIFSVTNDLATDNRVNRSCIVAQSLGFEVLLVGRKLPKSQDVTRSYATKRFRLIFKTGVLFYAAFQLRLFFYLLFKRVDLLYSNDLDTLFLCN